MTGLRRWTTLPLRALVLAYRYGISPVLPNACRFQPSCSAYALEALERHGALKGGWLTLRRLLRCHPWGGHGYDPVPGTHGGCGHGAHSPSPIPLRGTGEGVKRDPDAHERPLGGRMMTSTKTGL